MKINIELSKGSIRAAIQATKMQKERLDRLRDVFAKRLAMEGALRARTELSKYDAILTGELLSSIRYDCVKPGLWKVSCWVPTPGGENYAWYIEYGTGPAGNKRPHPEGGFKHKSTGWYTKADGKDMEALYGWKPMQDKEGNTFYYTAGQPAKPFMYNSKQYLIQPDVVNQIFQDSVREVFGSD